MNIVITENQILGPQKVLMDITVRGALAANAAVHLSAPNAQAQSGYDEKIRKYGASAAEANYKLVPMVFESTGRIHPDTLNTLRTIAGIQKDEKDVMRNHPRFRYWLASISMTLQRGIAAALLKGMRRVRNISPPSAHYTRDYHEHFEYYIGAGRTVTVDSA